jgi:hypothetical protein
MSNAVRPCLEMLSLFIDGSEQTLFRVCSFFHTSHCLKQDEENLPKGFDKLLKYFNDGVSIDTYVDMNRTILDVLDILI